MYVTIMKKIEESIFVLKKWIYHCSCIFVKRNPPDF